MKNIVDQVSFNIPHIYVVLSFGIIVLLKAFLVAKLLY